MTATPSVSSFAVQCGGCGRVAQVPAQTHAQALTGEVRVKCAGCHAPLPVGANAQALATPRPAAPINPPSALGTQMMGWTIMVASIVAALLVWSEFGTVEVPTGLYGLSSRTITNPVVGWVAFGIVAQGFAWLVLFLGVARAAENSEGARQEIAALRKQLAQR